MCHGYCTRQKKCVKVIAQGVCQGYAQLMCQGYAPGRCHGYTQGMCHGYAQGVCQGYAQAVFQCAKHTDTFTPMIKGQVMYQQKLG